MNKSAKNIQTKNTVLILGFFDGIHLGHREVISSAVNFAVDKNLEVVLLTFPKSPAEYFKKTFKYIYPRKYNYELIKNLGVNRIEETDFSKIVNIKAEEYIKEITGKYSPAAIFTGFNYTFGYKRMGTPALLKSLQEKYNYKYFCIPEYKINNQTVCSSKIKEFLESGNIKSANMFLGSNYKIESKVIKGNQLGRKIGFPTANLQYPDKIIQIPYGSYIAKTYKMPAMLNWGIKPTITDKNKAILEVHIPNFDSDLYGKSLRVEIIEKYRDEKKFNSIEELKKQLEKDKKACLELS